LCLRVADYGAAVHRVAVQDELGVLLAARCRTHGARRIAAPPGLPWAPAGVEVVTDDPPLTHRELDAVDGVVTGCALAIAETGTLALDGLPPSGRRALTLIPDLHLCVVEAAQIVPAVPDAIAGLSGAVADGRPVTLVSGPSATSDIELERVEGVHGPRRLEVFVVGSGAGAG
jgi:L-lactate dehydrogenase complex protein LldG